MVIQDTSKYLTLTNSGSGGVGGRVVMWLLCGCYGLFPRRSDWPPGCVAGCNGVETGFLPEPGSGIFTVRGSGIRDLCGLGLRVSWIVLKTECRGRAGNLSVGGGVQGLV